MTKQERKHRRVIALRDRVAARPWLAAYLAFERRLPFNQQGIFATILSWMMGRQVRGVRQQVNLKNYPPPSLREDCKDCYVQGNCLDIQLLTLLLIQSMPRKQSPPAVMARMKNRYGIVGGFVRKYDHESAIAKTSWDFAIGLFTVAKQGIFFC